MSTPVHPVATPLTALEHCPTSGGHWAAAGAKCDVYGGLPCCRTADVPDPPRFLNVDTIYHDSVMLTWKPPLNDGGGFITQYIVEKLEQGMTNWIRCCTTRWVCTHLNSLALSYSLAPSYIQVNLPVFVSISLF